MTSTDRSDYINKGDDDTSAQLDRPINTASVRNVRIGESPWHNRPFIGQIYDVRIYNVALSAQEIEEMVR